MARVISAYSCTISVIFARKNSWNHWRLYWTNACQYYAERWVHHSIGKIKLNSNFRRYYFAAQPIGNWSTRDIDFNERFRWDAALDMHDSYRQALKRGLPYPILTVAEYFSLGREGFAWGGQYRAAGYYASIMLWASLASWFLMNLLLLAVPRYGAYTKIVTGLLLVCTNIGYSWIIPKPPLTIIVEGGHLSFHFGWCYWLVMVAGILCLCFGTVISIVDLVWPHTFSTVLEVYFDTPYDRHVILEESHDVRYQKRNSRGPEEPVGLGSRILRRLSSKTRDQNNSAMSTGIENRGYQPNSPWRYPLRPRPPQALHRTISADSTSSAISRCVQMEMQPMQKMALTRKLP